jgi:hypothetical protein
MHRGSHRPGTFRQLLLAAISVIPVHIRIITFRSTFGADNTLQLDVFVR